MPALHIRNVDSAIISALKTRAKNRSRSLEGELREILKSAAFGDRESKLQLTTVHVGARSTYRREEIYSHDDG